MQGVYTQITVTIPGSALQEAQVLFNSNGFWTEHGTSNEEISHGHNTLRKQHHLTIDIDIYIDNTYVIENIASVACLQQDLAKYH